ncbi:HNH endonuclease signature motif containing protein, partial [Phytoactinopolyspora halotolerans]
NGRTMPATLAGMVEGAISYEHAVVIAKTMAKIPTDIPADDAARAEDDLAAFAREYDPATLQRLADHLLHVLTSDSLEDRDERAQRKRSLRICDRGDGTVRITGLLGTEAAAIVRSALDPLAAPEPGEDGEKDQRTADQRLADALTELARRALATDTLPTRHGHPTQLLLLANLNTLLDHTTSQNNHGSDGDGCGDSAHADPDSTAGAGAHTDAAGDDAHGDGNGVHVDNADTDAAAAGDGAGGAVGAVGAGVGREGGVFTAGGCPHPDTPPRWLQDTWARRFGVAPAELTHGGPISSESLRRLACDADITTVLVDQHGVPLRVGRTERLVTPGIYTALIARDRGCAFPGCTRPPAWTQAHHIVHWADGGPTDLENLVLVCTHHHRVIHHGGWQVRLGTDGHPEFLPPPWVDPDRTPRRNTRPRHDHQPPPDT